MNTFRNTKVKNIITIVLLCITGAVGILFAILGATRAVIFLGNVLDFVWNRLKGFIIGVLMVFPLWLLWWLISLIIDRARANRAERERIARQNAPAAPAAPRMRPICPKCGSEVLDAGRFCRKCGWDFTRPIEEANAMQETPIEDTELQSTTEQSVESTESDNVQSEGKEE